MHPKLAGLCSSLLLFALPLSVRADAPDPERRLYTKTFRVDPNPFTSLNFPDLVAPTPTELVKAHLGKRGLSFPDEGDDRRLFYNDRSGLLLVRATLAELDKVENALKELNITAPQVQVEVRIAEYNPADIPADLPEHLQKMFGSVQDPQNMKASVLTRDETKLLIRVLEQTPVDLISAPTIVTISGRQARITVEPAPPVIIDPPFTAPEKEPKATWTR
jgi:type II secretory pathway component GspD/PulD (secretin)